MVSFYYSIATGTDLANLVNVEAIISKAPHSLQNQAIPLLRPNAQRVLSGALQRNGKIVTPLPFSYLSQVDLEDFIVTIFGSYTTASKACVVSAIDTSNNYSPFRVTLDNPLAGQDFETVNSTWQREVRIPGFGWELQSTSITSADSPYTCTSSVRLIYADTSSGSITVTLPAANSPAANTVFSFVKTSASNTLTVQRAGSDTVNGGTSVAVTALYARVNLISNAGTAWSSI